MNITWTSGKHPAVTVNPREREKTSVATVKLEPFISTELLHVGAVNVIAFCGISV